MTEITQIVDIWSLQQYHGQHFIPSRLFWSATSWIIQDVWCLYDGRRLEVKCESAETNERF